MPKNFKYIYELYYKGKKYDEGTSKYITEKYDLSESGLRGAYHLQNLLLHRFIVKRRLNAK